MIDIERESELGGPLHSKGVMILSSFLGARYAHSVPLSLAASLVFEQSYGPVEGDSASLAELCALLSVLSGVPILQSLAVTGSVNQHGRVQAVGGVNEKIEGFFDVCAARGLTGAQGVVIPAGNVKHLMLREDVVAAAREGRFHIHAVDCVDDAIEILTGMPAGVPDTEGRVPAGSINFLVAAQLQGLSEQLQRFAGHKKPRRRGQGRLKRRRATRFSVRYVGFHAALHPGRRRCADRGWTCRTIFYLAARSPCPTVPQCCRRSMPVSHALPPASCRCSPPATGTPPTTARSMPRAGRGRPIASREPSARHFRRHWRYPPARNG